MEESLQEIEDARLREKAETALKQRATQLALLNEIGRQIAAVLELDGILDKATHLVQESFDYHHVAIFLVDHESGQLVMKAKAGSFAHLFPEDHRLKLGQGMVGWVGHHGEKLLANDVQAEPHFFNPYPDLIPTRAELSVPVLVGEEIVGVLDAQSPQINAFAVNDVLVMETLADQIAVAIENARLYQAIQQELIERKRVEKALRESEKRYRTLVQTSPSAIFYTDMGARIILCNQLAAKMHGYVSPEVMIGMNAYDLFPPEEYPKLNAGIAKLSSGTREQREEFTLIRKDGTRFPAEADAAVVSDDEGSPIGILSIVSDLTERKRIERYMLRTERLAAMGNTAAILAHEIKNPLQSVQSNVELVLDYALDPDEREEHLRLCYLEIERLVDLTNRLLSLAHPKKVFFRSASVFELIQRTLALVDKSLRKAGVKVTTQVPDDLPLIKVAPEQIIEVFLNLIINAIEAMPDGGQVCISAYQDAEWVQLAVTNYGGIIPPEHIDHIFDPFFTTKPSGTGLGLSVSQNILHKLGGDLIVENLYEEDGVKFTVLLPTSEVENEVGVI